MTSPRVPGGPAGRNHQARTPLWVRALGVAAVLFVAVVIILHLSGRGMGGHGMGDHGMPADTRR